MTTAKILVRKNDIVYVDMDGVLVQSGESRDEWEMGRLKQEFFLNKVPVFGALEAFRILSSKCDTYILTTPVWDNIHCWTEKRIWVEKYLGDSAKKKLILSHNKALCKGLLLIDDSKKHGANEFEGIHLHFGSKNYPNWNVVMRTLEFVDN